MRNRKKKCIMSALFCTLLLSMSGCTLTDTPENDCIVMQKKPGNEQAETVASADGLNIASQVQADEVYKKSLNSGSVEFLIHADVEIPEGEGFKSWKAKPYYFTQEDIDGWVQVLAQNQPLWEYDFQNGETLSIGDVTEWKQELMLKQDALAAEIDALTVGSAASTADQVWTEEVVKKQDELAQIEWGIEQCDIFLQNAAQSNSAEGPLKREIAWKLRRENWDEQKIQEEAEMFGGEGNSAADAGSIYGMQGVEMENETLEDEAEQTGRESLYGYVDMKDTFAPWADDEEKIYSCQIINSRNGENRENQSEFLFKREYRSDYGCDKNGSMQGIETKISKKEMRKAADALLEKLGITDMKCSETIPYYNYGIDVSPYGSHALEDSKAWCFSYTRVLEGIPLNSAPNKMMQPENIVALADRLGEQGYLEMDIQEDLAAQWENFWKELTPYWLEETLYIVFDDEGLVGVEWRNPCTAEKTSKESVFLLPFSEISQIFEKSLPEQPLFELMIQSGLQLHVDITEIKLGYMRVGSQERKSDARMIPVWDFYGTFQMTNTEIYGMDDDYCENNYGKWVLKDSMLTINATDGTIVNRGYGY